MAFHRLLVAFAVLGGVAAWQGHTLLPLIPTSLAIGACWRVAKALEESAK